MVSDFTSTQFGELKSTMSSLLVDTEYHIAVAAEDPDNNRSEFIVVRSGQLEFTDVGRLFYDMMFGQALIDISTIKTRVKCEKMLEVSEEILMDC